MKKTKNNGHANPVVSQNEPTTSPQGKNIITGSAATNDTRIAENPSAVAPNEETAPSGIDWETEFTSRSEALKREAEKVFEAQQKLKLDQESLELAQDACKREKERLESWNKDLLAKEKALRTREVSVAQEEKKVENNFEEERTRFNEEQARQREELVARLKQDETNWQAGFDSRRQKLIEGLQKEIDEQRNNFLEWKTKQISALAEREKQLSESEKKHSEFLAKIENMDNEQRRLQREQVLLKRREDAIAKEVESRVAPAVAAAKGVYDSEISTLKARIAALEKERSDLQRRNDNLTRILDRTGQDPQKFLSELTAAISLHDRQIEEGLSQSAQMPDIVVQKDEAIKSLKAEYDQLSAEYAERIAQQSQEAKLQAELREVKGKLEDAEHTLTVWEAERKRRSQIESSNAASHIKSILEPDQDLARTVDARGRETLPQDSELVWLEHIYQKMQKYQTPFPRRILYAFHTALKNAEFSPLTVLAGVSGTGKSMLPDLYAAFGGINFISVPVQPNWDCPESLLGFFNSLSGNFEATPLLKYLAQTQLWNKDFLPDGASREEASDNGLKDTLSIVLLDEMNLAHIELYFADFLSKLEERRGKTADIPRLKIKITDTQDYLLPMGRNVLWIGTMNQDETTKSLSDKVLDRSAIIDFPRPTTFNRRKKLLPREGLFAPAPLIKFSTWIQWNSTLLADDQTPLFTEKDDPVIEKYKKIVEEINAQMANAGRALGHRVWQSIEMYMANHPLVRFHAKQKDQAWKDALEIAFEDQLIQKIIPKLRGVDTATPGLATIRQILHDNDMSLALCEDYERAVSDLNDGQFIWSSSKYFSADNDLAPVEGIDVKAHKSQGKAVVRKKEDSPELPVAELATESAPDKPTKLPVTPPKTVAPAPALRKKAPITDAIVKDSEPTHEKGNSHPIQEATEAHGEFRGFLDSLNAGFAPSEISVIVTVFKTKDALIAKWNRQKGKCFSGQWMFFQKDLNYDGILATKLINALKKANL